MAKRKHDPFFTHLWDELLSARLLQGETFSKWIDLPVKLQSQFVDAAQRAMSRALGAPVKPRKQTKKAVKKTKKPKTKAKTKSRPKAKKG